MAELVNLRPLFPGSDQVDQIARICQVLGNPSNDYGMDSSGAPLGGGAWLRGLQMAQQVGFEFRPVSNSNFISLTIANFFLRCLRRIFTLFLTVLYLLRLSIAYATSSGLIQTPVSLVISVFTIVTSLNPSRSTISPYHLASAWPHLITTTHSRYIVRHFFLVSSPHRHHSPSPSPSPGFKWGLGRFGSNKHQQQQHHHHDLPPVHEIPAVSSSTGTLKRTQSAGSDNRSLKGEPSSPREPLRQEEVKRLNKKEAERLHREAEKQRRALALKMQREQARAVMMKRNMYIQHSESTESAKEIEWRGAMERGATLPSSIAKGKQAATGPIRRDREVINGHNPVNVSPVRFGHPPTNERDGGSERMTKVRRMEFDDDVSVSSSDMHSGRMSSISFATVDSDPGPSRIRNRPSLLGLNRVTSTSSSLRTSFDDFSHPRSHSSARSSVSNSNSFSLDGQLAYDFRTRASMNAEGLSPPHRVNGGSVSPPPMHALSLSPSLSPSPISLPPSPQWIQVPHQRSETLSARRGQAPPPSH